MSNTIVLKNLNGDEANIHLFGATVMSWKVNGNELLYLSSLAKLDCSKAIRGGIPVVFPNFGPWEVGPQHGFARSMKWKIDQQPIIGETAETILRMNENQETLKMWNYRFSLFYKIRLGPSSLQTTLVIKNIDDNKFDFTTLLHTYFRIPDITECTITGFKGHRYHDKVTGETSVIDEQETATVHGNVDRVYTNTDSHILQCGKRKVEITKENLPDTVLWNPWKEKAEAMGDFDNDGYKFMVCIEPGYVNERKTLEPGETFKCSQTLKCIQ